MISNISFKANYIKPTVVQKRTTDGSYADSKGSFIEFDYKNKKDMDSLKKVSDTWGAGTFAYDIYEETTQAIEEDNDENKHTYAITQQRSGFDDVNPDEIMGLAFVEEKSPKEKELVYLQVDPFIAKTYEDKPIRHIGSAMLESLKSISSNSAITLKAVNSAFDFYETNGFKNDPKRSALEYIWNA